jgi:hypothetical protein
MAYKAGHLGNVKVCPDGGVLVAIHASEWEGNFEVDDHDVTNFQSAGWQELSPGVKRGDISMKLQALSEEVVMGATIGLVEGAFIDCELYEDSSDKHAGGALVKSVSTKVDVKGNVTYDVKAKTSGPWTHPTS